MLRFLDVVPNKTVLEPNGLLLREASISRAGTMGYGKSLATFVTRNGRHYDAVRNDDYRIGDAFHVMAQPFGSAI